MSRVIVLAAFLVASHGLMAKDFPVGNAGVLQLDVAENWRDIPPPPGSMAGITVESKNPGRLQFLLTPLPTVVKTDGDIRQLVQQTADRIGPQSVEKTITARPLQGGGTKGYYFKATDPAPKAGEYRYMYQGAVNSGALFVTFTVLYNDGAEMDADAALAAMKNARFRPAAAGQTRS